MKAKRPFDVRLPPETIEALRGVAAVLTAVGGKRATASSAARHLIERGLLEYVATKAAPANDNDAERGAERAQERVAT